MDSRFAAAPLELARLHNENGDNAEAEQVLRESLKTSPEEGEIYYSLGLLLAEEQRLEEAEVYLRQAAQRLPQRARVFYNYSLALQRLDRRAEGEQQLLRAYKIGPTVPDTVNALVIFYLQERRLHEALRFAREMIPLAPGDPGPQQMVQRIEAELSGL
jgi:Flp pilus assembly protein TadD